MKIKQVGSVPAWELDVKCKNCQAIITLENANDLYKAGRSHECEDKYFFVCPLCHHHNTVPYKDIKDIAAKVRDAISYFDRIRRL